MDLIRETKEVLGVEDNDDKKVSDLEKKKQAGKSTDRERLELKELKEKSREEKTAAE